MSKSNYYFIEMLDNGFVIKSDGSKRAIETSQKVEELIIKKLKEMISGINKPGIHNMTINISVDENTPTDLSR